MEMRRSFWSRGLAIGAMWLATAVASVVAEEPPPGLFTEIKQEATLDDSAPPEHEHATPASASIVHPGLPGLGDSHLGCSSCAGGGPSCPYHEPQPTLAQIRAGVASQFLDFARPTSILRIHGDQLFNVQHPDRATYLWGKAGIESASPNAPAPGAAGAEEESVDFHHLSIYVETASSKKASAFFEFLLTGVDPERKHDRTSIGDISLGTKAVFCEKDHFLATFQFKTYLPTGKEETGNGNGHVSLEPGILTTWQLSPTMFLQNQASLWIPLGGDKHLKGEVVKWGASLNWIAWEDTCSKKAFIPTFEMIGWVALSGEYFSIEDDRNHPADGNSIVNVGPGFRYILTEKCEIGAGTNFNITTDQWHDWGYQVEFRWFF